MKHETDDNALFHVEKKNGIIEIAVKGEPDKISAILVLMMEREQMIEKMIRIALVTRLKMKHSEENKN